MLLARVGRTCGLHAQCGRTLNAIREDVCAVAYDDARAFSPAQQVGSEYVDAQNATEPSSGLRHHRILSGPRIVL
jgi:hypothetical protein